jgi:membrane-associated phospholipid phosphatase
VFVKQHYVADVIGGLLLAFGASLLFLKYVGSRQ